MKTYVDVENSHTREVKTIELPELGFTDIEMFFISDDNVPNFGLDYNFYIKDNTLVGIYNREIYLRKNI